jgi:hypothetical protein
MKLFSSVRSLSLAWIALVSSAALAYFPVECETPGQTVFVCTTTRPPKQHTVKTQFRFVAESLAQSGDYGLIGSTPETLLWSSDVMSPVVALGAHSELYRNTSGNLELAGNADGKYFATLELKTAKEFRSGEVRIQDGGTGVPEETIPVTCQVTWASNQERDDALKVFRAAD